MTGTRRAGGMAKKRSKAARRGDAFKLRMTRALARHGLTIDQAGQLSDSDLRRRRGIGRKMIAVIRAAGGPAPPPPPPTSEAAVTATARIAALERQVTELLEAVKQLQDLLRARGVDRRGHQASEQGTRTLRKGDPQDPPHADRPA